MSGCLHCDHMPLDPGQTLRRDRNGETHHPFCMIIGRDGWTDAILCAAWELAHDDQGDQRVLENARRLRKLVGEYDAWREQRGLRPMRFERILFHRRREERLRERYGDEWVEEHYEFPEEG